MDVVSLLLYLVSFICFVLAAFGVAARVNLIAVGLACWVLIPLIATAQAVL